MSDEMANDLMDQTAGNTSDGMPAEMADTMASLEAEVAKIASEKDPLKRKRVLLVDARSARRDVRAEMLRKLGIEVDGASDIHEARIYWRPNYYDLVLLHVENELAGRDTFCTLMRSASPSQQISFLVGKPEYIASLPNDDAAAMERQEEAANTAARRLSLANPSETWGILEACRQISVVRSIANARMRAIRDQPRPPRDSEIAPSRIKRPGLHKRDDGLTEASATNWISGY
jgi:CheY-like chemotaxis protein